MSACWYRRTGLPVGSRRRGRLARAGSQTYADDRQATMTTSASAIRFGRFDVLGMRLGRQAASPISSASSSVVPKRPLASRVTRASRAADVVGEEQAHAARQLVLEKCALLVDQQFRRRGRSPSSPASAPTAGRESGRRRTRRRRRHPAMISASIRPGVWPSLKLKRTCLPECRTNAHFPQVPDGPMLPATAAIRR